MRIASATNMFNDMVSMTKGSFHIHMIIHEMKLEVYNIYKDREELDREKFITICDSHISNYISKFGYLLEPNEKTIIRDLRLLLLGV